MSEWDKVQQAVRAIRDRTAVVPEIGIILGTGLGPVGEHVREATAIPYEEIPHFPVSTTEGHAGNLIVGTLSGRRVAAMQGRFHLYEGYSPVQIAFPVRVMKALGVSTLVESNAAGGLNPLFAAGDLVVIEDEINLMGANPLVGPNDDRFGVRFPDMGRPYDAGLIAEAEKTALREGIALKKGVLVGLTGPSLETRAEYRFLRAIGADMVCMSTVPEVIAAIHAGLKVFGVSIITDMCLPDALNPASLEDILATAGRAEPDLTRFVEKFILTINAG